MQDQASGRSPPPVARFFADVGMPETVTVEIERDDAAFAEEAVDSFAIARRGAAGVTVFGDVALVGVFGEFGRDGGCPQRLAIEAVDAEEVAFELVRFAVALPDTVAAVASYENVFTDHDRARRTWPWEFDLPAKVIAIVPG